MLKTRCARGRLLASVPEAGEEVVVGRPSWESNPPVPFTGSVNPGEAPHLQAFASSLITWDNNSITVLLV